MFKQSQIKNIYWVKFFKKKELNLLCNNKRKTIYKNQAVPFLFS